MTDLPVYDVRKQLLNSVSEAGRVLLRAPTGSGKSTCVPPILLDDGVEGLIVVVQPRRIAARMLASRVAAVRKVRVGGEIGYVVRHDNRMGKATRIVYLTDGVLQRWIQENPHLEGVDVVIFDEFHERRVASDVALARCLDLQEGARDDLKVIVMSATLEVEGLREYLEPCKMLETKGRMYPVEINYRGAGPPPAGGRNAPALWDRVSGAVRDAISQPDTGNILVFLPGVHEIRRTVEAIQRATWSWGWDVFPLYSSLPPAEQDAALADGGRPRVIVSTNVAETSLTIDGVRCVIDAGLARVSIYDPVRGIDTLMIGKISRASADQRAGRAGRTAPGRCIRLWSENDHAKRAAFELPEIKRNDLAEVILPLLAAGVRDIQEFRWLSPPDEHSIQSALSLLENLGAVDAEGCITPMGIQMASFPLHPRYSRLLLAGRDLGCVGEAGFVAAAIQSECVFLRGKGARKEFTEAEDVSDFIAEWRAYSFAKDMRFDPRRCGDSGILARAARDLDKALKQLRQTSEHHGLNWREIRFDSDSISKAMLVALSDRIAVQLGSATRACRVVGGRKGQLDAESAVVGADAFVAAEITEVEGREVTVQLSRCTKIDLAELREFFPNDLSEHDGAFYDETIRRVVNRRETQFRDLVLSSKDGGEPPAADAARLLAERVLSGELKLNKWDRAVEQWIARVINLAEWMPEMELPGFSDDDKLMVIEEVCQGAKSYKDIKNKEVMPVLKNWLSQSQKAVLDAYAPTEVKLSNERTAKVKYAAGKEPWIAMKMQHLYDVVELPKVADGKVGLLVHLLAPNQRPWQVTGDLKGFWERGYQQMKKDLAGRYPKHEWR